MRRKARICSGHTKPRACELIFHSCLPFLFWRTCDTYVCLPPSRLFRCPASFFPRISHASKEYKAARQQKTSVCISYRAVFLSPAGPITSKYTVYGTMRSPVVARSTLSRKRNYSEIIETARKKPPRAKLMAEAAGSAEPTADAHGRRSPPRGESVQRLNQASHQAAGRKLLAITPRRFGRNTAAHSARPIHRRDDLDPTMREPTMSAHSRARTHTRTCVYGVALRRFPKPPSSPRARC